MFSSPKGYNKSAQGNALGSLPRWIPQALKGRDMSVFHDLNPKLIVHKDAEGVWPLSTRWIRSFARNCAALSGLNFG
jgi:hypothetical protein